MADHAQLLDEQLDKLTHANPPEGWPTIVHHLELGFVHALQNVEGKALEEIAAADAEVEKFGQATYAHLEGTIALLKARIHAVLANVEPAKKPAAKKPAAKSDAKQD